MFESHSQNHMEKNEIVLRKVYGGKKVNGETNSTKLQNYVLESYSNWSSLG